MDARIGFGSLVLWSFRSFRFVSKQGEPIKRLIFRNKMLVVSSFHRFPGEGLPVFNLAVDSELKCSGQHPRETVKR